MGRTVFGRKKTGSWKEFGPGVSQKEKTEILGFEGMDGFSKKSLYAVGWGGEIWHYKNDSWKTQKSPVEANLNNVFCAPDQSVYVVGDDGTLLKGEGASWKALKTGRSDNLLDVVVHNETVFVCSEKEIFKLKNNKLVPESDFASKKNRPKTCTWLLKTEDGLISMGPKDLFRWTEKGWEKLV